MNNINKQPIVVFGQKMTKLERDLYLLTQTGMLTYEQLQQTGYHGTSKEACRAAVKKLKEQNLVEIQHYRERRKIIFLSVHGKEYVRQKFRGINLKKTAAQLEKAQIARVSPQFLHRLNTNTFYCCYLSAPAGEISIWHLEYAYDTILQAYGEGANRSDGFLSTADGYRYYIEQDNCTQRVPVLLEKITKYLQSDVFSNAEKIEKNVLVFSVDARVSEKKKEKLQKNENMRMYRNSLKVLKLWKLLEHTRCETLDLEALLDILKDDKEKEIVSCILSEKEIENVIDYYSTRTTMIKADILAFAQYKDQFRVNGMENLVKKQALDAAFEKRVLQFRTVLELDEEGILSAMFLKGMRLYLLPLHDMQEQQPYLMVKEYRTKEAYLKCMTCMGLNASASKLHFHTLYEIPFVQEVIWFRNVFVWPFVYVVWEDISADIGAFYRISWFLKKHCTIAAGYSLIFILLVKSQKEAQSFFENFESHMSQLKCYHIFFFFLVKGKQLFENLMLSPFGFRRRSDRLEIGTVFLEEKDGVLAEVWEDEA